MGISWLLFKKSGKQSLGRLSLTAAAIGLGIVMILSFIAGINAIISRQSHDTWRYLGYSGGQQLPQAKEAQKPIAGVAPLKISSMGTINNLSQWQTKSIDTVSLHASGSNSPEFPGMKTPAAGEYYLRQASQSLTASTQRHILATATAASILAKYHHSTLAHQITC